MHQQEKKFVPVMLTPFQKNGAIDFDGLTELTEFYLEAGAGGLFANCQSSEMYHLSPDERIRITQHIIKVTKGRVPVVATGSFGGPIAKQVDFIKEMNDQGTEAIILISGILVDEAEGDELLRDRFYEIMDTTTGILFGFYECPEPYKRLINPELLAELVHTNRVIYHKDTSLDLQQVREKIRLTSDHHAFGLYDAYMVNAVASLQSGAAGLSCIQGNYFPELVVWLCQHYAREDERQLVDEVGRFFVKHMDLMHDNYPFIAKYYLQRRGLHLETFCRKPYRELDATLLKKLDELDEDRRMLFEQLSLKEALAKKRKL